LSIDKRKTSICATQQLQSTKRYHTTVFAKRWLSFGQAQKKDPAFPQGLVCRIVNVYLKEIIFNA